MYETLILIDPNDDIPADAVGDALAAMVARSAARPRLVRLEESFRVEWPDFHITVGRSELPHVVDESRQLAEQHVRDQPVKDAVSRCVARLEIAGGDDWDMAYFNDYCLIVEGIERLGTVYVFDQGSAEFTNM